ncbi:glycosyltransferase family 2 protein [Candidatus Collierbacteria bacterium]|nr:glycosyltransferase family 2 protein [Candidatus Collierbacteria bacterium]
MKLSAIVITNNSAAKIKGCLKSLKFADEIIVVDSGSTDKTKELVEKTGARVFEVENVGYSHSRNVGAQKAKGEWLLYIDADERVTPELEKAISVIASPVAGLAMTFQSYKIYRKNIILGKWLKHGGWWPDPVHRLIKKSALKEWTGKLHEYPIIDGNVGLITEPLVHFSKGSISEMVKNSRDFVPIEAQLKSDAGHPPVKIYHFVLAMWREFWTRGILKAGWLDGIVGIIEIFYQMFHQFMVYSILWQMQQSSFRHPERNKKSR